MTEAEAYRRQAQSDFRVYELLAGEKRADVPECHALHYLQMATEKIAKAAFLALQVEGFDKYSHVAFSELRRHLKRRDLAPKLAFRSFRSYRAFLKRAGSLFRRIDELSPAVGPQQPGGGPKEGPNSEYPWRARDDAGQVVWHVPAEHSFGLLAELEQTTRGAQVIDFVHTLIARFDGVFSDRS
jgi:hypothetical protein